MNKEVTKYDVMNKKMVNLSSSVVKSVAVYAKAKLIDREKNDGVARLKMIKQWYKDFLTICHICYEASNDIIHLDEEDLIHALDTGKISMSDLFQVTKKDEYGKFLLFNIMLEKEGINYADDSLVQRLQQHNGNIDDMLKDISSSFSDEKRTVVMAMEKDNFSLEELPDSYRQVLDEYHLNFMNQNIYPEVTKEQTTMEQGVAAVKTLTRGRNIKINVKL